MRSHREMWLLWICIAAAGLALGSPALADRTDPLGGTGGGPIDGTLHVQVVYDGTSDPFAGAFVMVGSRPGSPCAENWGFTSPAGEITFTDPTLQGPLPVTVGAAGYRYATFVAVDANELVVPLKPIATADPTYEVGDRVSGIDVDNGFLNVGDGYVDLALVLPAMSLEDLLSFELAGLFGPLETIEILGEPFDVPSNFYIPQQYELFVAIAKEHYYLYLEEGAYTLAAMSGRISRDVLLAGGDIQQLLPSFQWRETDVLDVAVAGNLYTADLTVDPDLTTTVTLDLANLPEGSTTYCISAGDLDGLAGNGRLVPLGITSYDCVGGGGSCAGSVQLTTTAASGEFASMSYFPAVAVDLADGEDLLVYIDRAPHPQSYTADMGSLFQILDLAYEGGQFAWNDAANPASGSPPVDLQIARIKESGGEAVYWEFLLPRGEHLLTVPTLPAAAPPGPASGATYTWEQTALALGYELDAFDFDDFALSDIAAHGSHLARDQVGIVFTADAAVNPVAGNPADGLRLAAGPNPFHRRATIRFELDQPGEPALEICSVDGRRVATLHHGHLAGGPQEIHWTGRDAHGRAVPGGIYYAILRLGKRMTSRRLVLIR